MQLILFQALCHGWNPSHAGKCFTLLTLFMMIVEALMEVCYCGEETKKASLGGAEASPGGT